MVRITPLTLGLLTAIVTGCNTGSEDPQAAEPSSDSGTGSEGATETGAVEETGSDPAVGNEPDCGEGCWSIGDFQVTWSPTEGTLSATHISEVDHVMWSTAGRGSLTLAVGDEAVEDDRGSFEFEDRVEQSCAESDVNAIVRDDAAGELIAQGSFADCDITFDIRFSPASPSRLRFEIVPSDAALEQGFNRAHLTTASQADEGFFGFGAQYSYGDHKGQRLPVWAQEQGLGRGLEPLTSTLEQFGAGASAGAWYSSYTGVPAFVTNTRRAVAIENTEYLVFDMTSDTSTTIEAYSANLRGQIMYGATHLDLMTANTEYSGRMEPLPSWTQNGPIVRVYGGSDAVRAAVAEMRDADVPVGALWIEDWAGTRDTLFGVRMWWNWVVDETLYPDWAELIAELRDDDIRTVIYFNPFLADVATNENATRNLFAEALEAGYFVEERGGGPVLVESAGFDAAMMDFTNPDARAWLKQLMREQIDLGVSGWMADFGEALPYSARLFSGVDPAAYHNMYPYEWAALNRELTEEAGVFDDFLYFSRSGNGRSPAVARLFWIGDQVVSWDAFDGIKTVVPALTSSGLSGYTLQHSDVGGYLSLDLGPVEIVRDRQLFQRWLEMGTFSPVLRLHSTNLPELNHQYNSDEETLAFFSRFSKIFGALAPYREKLMEEAAELGYPMIRHPMLHFGDDPEVYNLSQQYMFGSEFMVAPIVDEDATEAEVYLPAGRWVHVWTDEVYGDSNAGTRVTVSAPIGQPPVFFVEGSQFGEDFVGALVGQSLR